MSNIPSPWRVERRAETKPAGTRVYFEIERYGPNGLQKRTSASGRVSKFKTRRAAHQCCRELNIISSRIAWLQGMIREIEERNSLDEIRSWYYLSLRLALQELLNKELLS